MDSRVRPEATEGFMVSDESPSARDEPSYPAPIATRPTTAPPSPPPPPRPTRPPLPPATERSLMGYTDLLSLVPFALALWALASGQTWFGSLLILTGVGVRLIGHFSLTGPEEGPLVIPLTLIGIALLLHLYSTHNPYSILSARLYLLGNYLILVSFPVLALGPRLALLRRQHVIDRWDALIDAGRGQGDQVVWDTVTELSSREVPHIRLRQADLAPGILRALLGDKRPFLIVTHDHNHRLKPYRTYIMVRDYGTSLQACWYLAYRPHLLERLQPNQAGRLDLFDEQDLRAYVSSVHHALIYAVVTLLANAGQDASTLNRTSKGFLGIS